MDPPSVENSSGNIAEDQYCIQLQKGTHPKYFLEVSAFLYLNWTFAKRG